MRWGQVNDTNMPPILTNILSFLALTVFPFSICLFSFVFHFSLAIILLALSLSPSLLSLLARSPVHLSCCLSLPLPFYLLLSVLRGLGVGFGDSVCCGSSPGSGPGCWASLCCCATRPTTGPSLPPLRFHPYSSGSWNSAHTNSYSSKPFPLCVSFYSSSLSLTHC